MSLFDLFRRKPTPAENDNGYFEEPMPTVTEDRRKEIGEAILKQLQASGMIPAGADVKVSHMPVFIGSDEPVGDSPTNHGIRPPSDVGADGWSWEAWSKEQRALAFPGWAPCRFAHRCSPLVGADTARFVFGITQGPFGIWKQNFDVCSTDDEGEYQREKLILACLTHLPTGMGLGIFRHVGDAAMAADTMIRTSPQLADAAYDNAPGSPWSTLIERAVMAWKAIGIQPSFNSHAHDLSTGSGPHFIMALGDNLEAGKPEKLS